MSVSNKANKNNGWREEGTLFTAAESVNWPSHCRINTEVSQTMTRSTLWCTFSTPYTNSTESKSACHKKTCTSRFIAAVFPQLRNGAISDIHQQMKSIYTVKFYSAIKKIYTVAFVAEWIELDRCIKGNEPDSEKTNTALSLLCRGLILICMCVRLYIMSWN